MLYSGMFLLSKYHVGSSMLGTMRNKRVCLVPHAEELTMSLEITHLLTEPDHMPVLFSKPYNVLTRLIFTATLCSGYQVVTIIIIIIIKMRTLRQRLNNLP